MKKIILFCILFAVNTHANEFSFKLYDQLSRQDGNLFFSPASIEAALAMTAQGAAGTTRKQFEALLPENKLTVPTIGTNATLDAANAIWVDQTFPILGNFKSSVTETGDADLCAADFRGRPDAERQTINKWVEEKTRDKIKDLLPAGSVNAMTRMVLVNAIYFKGDWLQPFNPQRTADTPFRISETESIPVPMMRLNGRRFRYGETDRFQTLELPYAGREISMVLILPKPGCAAPELQEALQTKMHRREVSVLLPRFTMESTFASLKKTLAALGLTAAFDPQRADFSGISKRPLHISDVVHKAFVEVNEKGTEAAAATGVMMRTTSMPAPPKIFRADRPFAFLIRENSSGSILFMGRVRNPLN